MTEHLKIMSISEKHKIPDRLRKELPKWKPLDNPIKQLEAKGHKFLKDKYFDKWKLRDGTVIYNKPRYIRSSAKIDDVYGYDTETYKGTCKLLCSSNENQSYLLNPSFDECLQFLFYNASHNTAWRFFYNIDFDYNAIIKLIINTQKKKERNFFGNLMICLLNDGIEVQYGIYTIKYIKGIMLIIKDNKRHKVVITDLFRLFRMSLNDASIDFLDNEHKDKIDGNKLNTDLNYWNENIKDIIKYCIKDCILVRKLGMIFLEHLQKANVEIPKYLCSPASLSKAEFRKNCYIPQIHHIPKEVLQVSYDCYYGGRFELVKRGTFKEMYNYDINSEYPSYIKELPSLSRGLWSHFDNKHQKRMMRDLPTENQMNTYNSAKIGYFNVKLLIPDDNLISTIPVRHKGIITFPNGLFEGWYTWFDLDLMRDYITEIKEAYIYEQNSKFEYKVFEKEIIRLYDLKAKHKKDSKLMYLIYKLTMNAFYGCNFEIHVNKQADGTVLREAGMLFNPVYASQITAFGRWKILKPAWSERENFIGFHTDSILSEVPLDKYLDIGKGLGQWSLEGKGKGYIISTGMYQIDSKPRIIKTRGVPKKYIHNWFWFAGWNYDLTEKEFFIKRMTKLSQALKQYKDLDMVNVMNDNKKTININSDHKRTWFRDFDNFKDTLSTNLNSLPLICIIDELIPNPLLI